MGRMGWDVRHCLLKTFILLKLLSVVILSLINSFIFQFESNLIPDKISNDHCTNGIDFLLFLSCTEFEWTAGK